MATAVFTRGRHRVFYADICKKGLLVNWKTLLEERKKIVQSAKLRAKNDGFGHPLQVTAWAGWEKPQMESGNCPIDRQISTRKGGTIRPHDTQNHNSFCLFHKSVILQTCTVRKFSSKLFGSNCCHVWRAEWLSIVSVSFFETGSHSQMDWISSCFCDSGECQISIVRLFDRHEHASQRYSARKSFVQRVIGHANI